MHLRRGARHAGDGASSEQEEEEIRRLPVHGPELPSLQRHHEEGLQGADTHPEEDHPDDPGQQGRAGHGPDGQRQDRLLPHPHVRAAQDPQCPDWGPCPHPFTHPRTGPADHEVHQGARQVHWPQDCPDPGWGQVRTPSVPCVVAPKASLPGLPHQAVEMNLKLQSVEYVVFDEADRLFEMGFAEQLQEIIGRLPGGHQTVLFSATLPKLLVEFARAGLTEPVLIRLDVDSKLNEQLKTSFFLVREDAKAAVLLHLLRNVVRPQDQTVVFVATKHHAEYLSETARKINLARFTHGKCSALIVTDLAARGLDIPLLDNVINYSFPAKGKLFLHRVGRVARAGRSGTAYSLVAPDEVPYLLDLHLFLGRALTLARPPQEPSAGTEGGDGVLGRVPQGVVDDEDCGLRTSLEASLELRGLSRVADNAQQQYVRSRPAPSPESIKRAKELDLAGLGLQPLFSSRFQQEELQRLRLVDSIRNYRSRADVFTEVVSRKRQQPGPHWGAKRRREEARQRDQAFYIPYRPKDFDSERGLSVGGDGGAFEQQVAGAVLDLMGEEAQSLTRGRQQLKW
ncbi:hypothetical protein Celaphus_00000273 [Cervus elaphus hippelaphus]|uniref:Uncharacterized protein n=1 Tax=Cervus elaphus hippelaphus TaxID=46360 RepID=A0A212D9K8_CEREH|nr:hypothetical protein Celaphus_00000273 [Cervus elaphus hippelaphus]